MLIIRIYLKRPYHPALHSHSYQSTHSIKSLMTSITIYYYTHTPSILYSSTTCPNAALMAKLAASAPEETRIQLYSSRLTHSKIFFIYAPIIPGSAHSFTLASFSFSHIIIAFTHSPNNNNIVTPFLASSTPIHTRSDRASNIPFHQT